MSDGTSQEKRARARAFAQEGMSCRAIGERLGVSRTTVSRWAKEDGYGFDRSLTEAATAARQFDMKAIRDRLIEKMSGNGDRALDSVEGRFLVYSFGGKDNTYTEHWLDQAPISARREAQTIAGIAVDKLTKALERDTSSGDAAAGVLDQVGNALVTAAALLRDDGSE